MRGARARGLNVESLGRLEKVEMEASICRLTIRVFVAHGEEDEKGGVKKRCMQFSPKGLPLADSFGNNLVRRYRPGVRLGGHDKFDNDGRCIMMNLTRKGGKEQEAFYLNWTLA